jgi:hypothetical protein
VSGTIFWAFQTARVEAVRGRRAWILPIFKEWAVLEEVKAELLCEGGTKEGAYEKFKKIAQKRRISLRKSNGGRVPKIPAATWFYKVLNENVAQRGRTRTI